VSLELSAITIGTGVWPVEVYKKKGREGTSITKILRCINDIDLNVCELFGENCLPNYSIKVVQNPVKTVVTITKTEHFTLGVRTCDFYDRYPLKGFKINSC